MRNLAAYEKKTGWRYSITCTNIPVTGIGGVPGRHHPQYIDVTHREHAVVETGGVRTAKAMGPRNLPSKAWQVNKGWLIGANIAADLTAWTRLLGFCDHGDLSEADPDTLRYRIWHIPARLARHARQRLLKISPTGHGRTRSLPAGSYYAHCQHPPDQHEPPANAKGERSRRGRSRRAPGHTGHRRMPLPRQQTDTTPKTGTSTISNRTRRTLKD